MTKSEPLLVKKVEQFLTKKELRLVLIWWNKLSGDEQLDWLQIYKQLFDAASPPTIDDLNTIRDYFSPIKREKSTLCKEYLRLKDGIERNSLLFDRKKREEIYSAFSKLNLLFPTPDQWSDYLLSMNPYPYLDYRAEGYDSAEEYLKNHQLLSLNQDNCELEEDASALPFFDQNHNDQCEEVQYIRQAEALIELHRYKRDIFNMFPDQSAQEDPKPHKDEIYKWYEDLKSELQDKQNAFDALCSKIRKKGLKTSDYMKTEEAEHFDRSYRNWLKKRRERNSTSEKKEM